MSNTPSGEHTDQHQPFTSSVLISLEIYVYALLAYMYMYLHDSVISVQLRNSSKRWLNKNLIVLKRPQNSVFISQTWIEI
jgi:hypothetical protein